MSSIRLFEDVNNVGFFDVEETSADANGILLHLMSKGRETFIDKTTTLKLKPQVINSETVNPSGQDYFLTYDINAFAQSRRGRRRTHRDHRLLHGVDYPDFAGFVSMTPPFQQFKVEYFGGRRTR